MKKVFVLDTNVILHDAYSIYKLGNENEVIIPAIVLEELDSKKTRMDEVGKNAREFSRLIDKMKTKYPRQLYKGVPLENGGILRIELNHIAFDKVKNYFRDETPDNRIIAVVDNIHNEIIKNKEDKEVIFITNDILPGIKCDVLGITAQKYENDRLIDHSDHLHKGYHKLDVPTSIIDQFYENKGLDWEDIKDYRTKEDGDNVHPQDFFILKSNDGQNSSAIGRLLEIAGKKKVVSLVLDTDEEIFSIKGKNAEQKMFLELLNDPNVSLVCGIGGAGTGKTLLALASALEQMRDNESTYKKILVARPIVPLGKDLGYLPGEKEEKIRPWMQPIYDNLEFLFNQSTHNIEKEEKDNKEKKLDEFADEFNLQIEALTYIRGRSIPDQFIILDEAQNLTPHEAQTIITRVGEGSKIILIGDPEQIDHPYLDSTNNGLTYVTERMKQETDVGVVKLTVSERSPLAEKASRLLKK